MKLNDVYFHYNMITFALIHHSSDLFDLITIMHLNIFYAITVCIIYLRNTKTKIYYIE